VTFAGGTVELWRIHERRQERPFRTADERGTIVATRRLDASSDDRYLATGRPKPILGTVTSPVVQVWEIMTGEQVVDPDFPAITCAFSPTELCWAPWAGKPSGSTARSRTASPRMAAQQCPARMLDQRDAGRAARHGTPQAHPGRDHSSAGNSFLLKGWAVTLVAGLTALAKTGGDRGIAWIACGVVVAFAMLDATYWHMTEHSATSNADAAKSQPSVPRWSLEITKPSLPRLARG
jgi:hypothetical protein